jgi:streptomycin 6-kinase
MFSIPEAVRHKAQAAGALPWLAGLPDLVAHLEREWAVRLVHRLDGGTEAFLAEVLCEDGTPAVLKLIMPGDATAAANEINVLRMAGGRGCARLLRFDEGRGVLLMERLGRKLSDLGLSIERRHVILCATAARLWEVTPDVDLPTGAAKGRWLVQFITTTWEELDRPCSERVIEHALACAESRISAHHDERSVLVHGDVHQWNTLEAGDGFKLVDPDGLLAEAEYDLGIIMREDPIELLEGDPRDRARKLAALTGRDATAIWEWGAVERVSTGLLATQVGLQPAGREMLTAAERVAAL